MGTFHKFSDKICMGCKEHGLMWYLKHFPGKNCRVCRDKLVEVPDGVIFVYGEQDDREAR